MTICFLIFIEPIDSYTSNYIFCDKLFYYISLSSFSCIHRKILIYSSHSNFCCYKLFFSTFYLYNFALYLILFHCISLYSISIWLCIHSISINSFLTIFIQCYSIFFNFLVVTVTKLPALPLLVCLDWFGCSVGSFWWQYSQQHSRRLSKQYQHLV